MSVRPKLSVKKCCLCNSSFRRSARGVKERKKRGRRGECSVSLLPTNYWVCTSSRLRKKRTKRRAHRRMPTIRMRQKKRSV